MNGMTLEGQMRKLNYKFRLGGGDEIPPEENARFAIGTLLCPLLSLHIFPRHINFMEESEN